MQVLWQHAASPIQEFRHPLLDARGLTCVIKRDDLLQLEFQAGDQAFCGNKWRKLKYNLLEARNQGCTALLTFGGAYSNHIAATASAGKLFGFETIGIIRGEAVTPLNPTLQFAKECGMALHYWSREGYRSKAEPDVLAALQNQYPQAYILPEGGSNALALRGCAELAEEILDQIPLDYLCVSCGTGGTLAGLIQGMAGRAVAWGFSALKGDFHQEAVRNYLAPNNWPNWDIATDYHFGGYAKTSVELLDFMAEMEAYYDLPLEPIYTAKLLYGVLDMAKKSCFPTGSSICVLHTGGLQGWKGKK